MRKIGLSICKGGKGDILEKDWFQAFAREKTEFMYIYLFIDPVFRIGLILYIY